MRNLIIAPIAALAFTLCMPQATFSQQTAPVSKRLEFGDDYNQPGLPVIDEVRVNDLMLLEITTAEPCNGCCSYTLELELGVNHNSEHYIADDRTVTVRLEYFDDTDNTSLGSEELTIIHSNDPTHAMQDKAYTILSLQNKIRVELESIVYTPALQNPDDPNLLLKNLYIDARLSRNCNVNFDYDETDFNLAVATLDSDCSYTGQPGETADQHVDELVVSWDYIDGATEYQLEWTFVNDYAATFETYKSNTDVFYDFGHNSTRITTTSNSYKIPRLFDHGYVLFRVRGLGYNYDPGANPNFKFPGAWSSNNNAASITDGAVSASNALVYHNQFAFEETLNWQATTTFAEEGKKKEVMSFFDGSQRNRQTITRLNTLNKVVVGETIYDHQGRPAVNILPVPVTEPGTSCGNLDNYSSLHYYENFNLSENLPGNSYSRNDFDKDEANGVYCPVTTADAMATSNGAGQYYSPNNPEQNAQQAYVPDAEGYPFTQVEYMPDNTGRIRAQSGVGPDFQLQGGHETKYYYGSPFQIELNRMFGAEVGNASHYQKNMVMDPNGQTSISYLDMEGRTIATCLAGETPVNLEPLGTLPANPTELTVSLLAEDAPGTLTESQYDEEGNLILSETPAETTPSATDGIILDTKTLVVSVPGTYSFEYNLHNEPLTLTCTNNPNLCVSCVYNLQFSLIDECGEEKFGITELQGVAGSVTLENGPINIGVPTYSVVYNDDGVPSVETTINPDDIIMVPLPQASTCSDGTGVVNYTKVFATVTLGIGSYQVSKLLTLNEDAIQQYADAYALTNCDVNFQDILEAEYAAIDLSGCYTDCEECAAGLGTRDAFIANGGDAAAYDEMYADCMDMCDEYIEPCATALELMLTDVSLAGQYCEFTVDGENYLVSNHPLSILNTSNQLPHTDANWRNPNNPFVDGVPTAYYDEEGNRTKIPLDITDTPELYEPAVLLTDADNNGLHDFVYIDEFGGIYTYPEYLANVKDFIAEFDAGWAKSLVSYHPEYCYYEACLHNGPDEYEQCGNFAECGPMITNSTTFDHLLINTNTIEKAETLGFLNGSSVPYNWTLINAQGLEDPFATDDDGFNLMVINEIQTELQAKWNNYTGAPFNMSLPAFAAYITLGPTIDNNLSDNVLPNPLPVFGQQYAGLTLTTEQWEVIFNDEWQTLKNLYYSAKQQAQLKYYHAHVIEEECIGYNQCMGEDYFNPWQHWTFMNDNSVLGYLDGPYFNPDQPCGSSTYALYANKIPRFMGIEDYEGIENASNSEYMAYQMYLQTGQCPVDFNLQVLLNAIAGQHHLLATNNPLIDYNEMLGLSLALNDVYGTNAGGWDWKWTGSVYQNTLTANWTEVNPDNSAPICNLILNGGTAIANLTNGWADVSGIRALDFTTESSGTYNFNIEVGFQPPIDQNNNLPPMEWHAINGSTTCMTLGSCSFEPLPQPNDLALGLLPLFNYANTVSSINTSLLFDENPLTEPDIASAISNHLGAGDNDPILFSFVDAAQDYWKIQKDGVSYPYIKLAVNTATTVNNANWTDWNFGAGDYFFQNLNTACEHYWTMDIMNVNGGTLAGTIEGEAWLVTSATTDEPLSLGSCDWPDPLECASDAHQTWEDLTTLLIDVLPEITETSVDQLVTNTLYTQLLESQNGLENDDVCTTENDKLQEHDSSIDHLTFFLNNDCSCFVELDLVEVNPAGAPALSVFGATHVFELIDETAVFTPVGEPDASGNYHEFEILISRGYHQMTNLTKTWLIHGYTPCMGYLPCEFECAEEATAGGTGKPNLPNTGLEATKKADNSVDKYQEYKEALIAFNSMLGYLPEDAEYISPEVYTDFFLGGSEYSVEEYSKFLSTFSSAIDNIAKAEQLGVFAAEYGNSRNPLLEYLRYLDIVEYYNSTTGNALGYPITAINYSEYTYENLATVSAGYLDYLNDNSFGATPPSLVEWRDAEYGNPTTDICTQKYNKYLIAYRYFAYTQTENVTCEGFEKLFPLYTREDFEASGLCCSNQSLSEFTTYINNFYDPADCPAGMPYIEKCDNSGAENVNAVVQKETSSSCAQLYRNWLTYIGRFNTMFLQCTLSVGPYRSFQEFESAGLCECVRDYLVYLEGLMRTGTITTCPVDVWNWGSCAPKQDNTCYEDYLAIMATYNNFVNSGTQSTSQTGGYVYIKSITTQSGQTVTLKFWPIRVRVLEADFIDNELCDCLPEWQAFLNALMDGAYPDFDIVTDGWKLDLATFCQQRPCEPEMNLMAMEPLPAANYIDPCAQGLIDNAYNNALNLYNNLIEGVKSEFIQSYTSHCLENLTETFTTSYFDKQYHYTLYYYDQAGNLVRTVPPEGNEPLYMTREIPYPQGYIFDEGEQDGYINFQLTEADKTDENPDNVTFTSHRMATTYTYNSLNQLIAQKLPDHDGMVISEKEQTIGIPEDVVVTNIQMVNANLGYLTGYKTVQDQQAGCVYKTQDAGHTWAPVRNILGATIYDMAWYGNDAGKAIAVGEGGTIMQTTDGGQTWLSLSQPYMAGVFENLQAIAFNDEYNGVVNGIVVGDKGVAIKIVLTGDVAVLIKYIYNVNANFTGVVAMGGEFNYRAIANYQPTNGLPYSKTISTTNSGQAWSVLELKSNTLNIAQCGPANVQAVAGRDGQIYILQPDGNYVQKANNLQGDILDIMFFTATSAVAIVTTQPNGTQGKLMRSTDGGASWNNLPNQTSDYTKLHYYGQTENIMKAFAQRNGNGPCRVLCNATTGSVFLNTANAAVGSASASWAAAPVDPESTFTPAILVNTTTNKVTNEVEFPSPDWGTISAFNDAKAIEGISTAAHTAQVGVLVGTNLNFYNITQFFTETPTLSAAYSTQSNIASIAKHPNQNIIYVLKNTADPNLYTITLNGTTVTISPNTFDSFGANKLSVQGNTLVLLNTSNGKVRHYNLNGSGLITGNASDKTVLAVPLQDIATIPGQSNTTVSVGQNGTVLFASTIAHQPILSYYNADWNSIATYTQGGFEFSALLAGNNGTLVRMKLETLNSNDHTTNNTINTQTSQNLTDIAWDDATNKYYVVGANNTARYSSNGLSNSAPQVVAGGVGSTSLKCAMIVEGTNLDLLCAGSQGRFQRKQLLSSAEVYNVYTQPLRKVHFAEGAYKGTIVGDYGTVRITNNSGNAWAPAQTLANPNAVTHLYAVHTSTNGTRLVGGDHGFISKVENGIMGADLCTSCGNAAADEIRDIEFNSFNDTYMAAGQDGGNMYVCRSIGGDLWTTQSQVPSLAGSINDMAILPLNDHLLCVGNAGRAFYIKNGQAAQTVLVNSGGQGAVTYFNDLYTISLIDGITAIAAGADGLIIKSDNNSLALDAQTTPGTYNYSGWVFNLPINQTDESNPAQNDVGLMDIYALAPTGPYTGIVGGSYDANQHYSRLYNDQSGEYSTLFYYDMLGRIVASQNTKQARKHAPQFAANGTLIAPTEVLDENNVVIDRIWAEAWSYTLYDGLGRVYQAGQKYENDDPLDARFNSIFGMQIGPVFNPRTIDYQNYEAWIGESSGSRQQVTTTQYDEVVPEYTDLPTDFFVAQNRHARKRVTSVCYETVFDEDPASYHNATHYAYDIHGNVHTLLQDNANLPADLEDQRFKRVEYTYDLISGNVHEVRYQPGAADQMTHRYTYDADNRIVDVHTSANGLLWDKDAHYIYYDHGPLARVELGDNQVQGLDYTYNLQGWLKATNSSSLNAELDMGKDSHDGSTNQYFAEDAMSFSLHYFSGDYQRIGTTTQPQFLANTSGSTLESNREDLWNGNIGMMLTNIKDPDPTDNPTTDVWGMLGMAYRYDQLNRLVLAGGYSDFVIGEPDPNTIPPTPDPGSFGSGNAGKYKNGFTYDANGNILSQDRRDQSGQVIDNLSYQYNRTPLLDAQGIQMTDGQGNLLWDKMLSNRLYSVDDANTNTAQYSDDIDDMPTYNGTNVNVNNNYGYTEIGELLRDNAEDIEQIVWRVDSKIAYIYRTDESAKKELGFEYDAMGNRIAKHIYSAVGVWEKSTFYVRDASGNVMAAYEETIELVNIDLDPELEEVIDYDCIERPIYGSSRVGMETTLIEMVEADAPSSTDAKRTLGYKQYELSNHLGNVLAVVNDMKLPDFNGTLIVSYTAVVVSATDYSPFGTVLYGRSFSTSAYRYGFNGKEKDDESFSGDLDFGARVLDVRLGRWLTVDPFWWLGTGTSPYNFALNVPIVMIDPSGGKERPYVKGKSKPIQELPNTKTPAYNYDKQGESTGWHPNCALAYNCHSYAWHNSGQDTYDPYGDNAEFSKAPLWDQNATDDIEEQNPLQLRSDIRNKVGDRVIYYQDSNGDGEWSLDEPIAHSAIVDEVDSDGNTTVVRSKMGEEGISYNHPGAPGFYEKDGDKKLSRTYMRVSGNYQNLYGIRFDSDTAIPVMKADGKTIDYLIVQDLNTGKDYGVTRNANGSYSFYEPTPSSQTEKK
ncbi:MAG: RHS repeat-associated core domain-containing protein [Flavobacteriales bacterium]